jgi:hypothetical protein
VYTVDLGVDAQDNGMPRSGTPGGGVVADRKKKFLGSRHCRLAPDPIDSVKLPPFAFASLGGFPVARSWLSRGSA